VWWPSDTATGVDFVRGVSGRLQKSRGRRTLMRACVRASWKYARLVDWKKGTPPESSDYDDDDDDDDGGGGVRRYGGV